MKIPSAPRDGASIAKDYEDLRRAWIASRIVKVIGGSIRETTSGSILDVTDRSPKFDDVRFEPGAFFGKYHDSAGDLYFQAGTVTGDNGGSVTLDDYKVVDSTSGTVGSAGDILWVKADCTATVEDGLMLPGCLLTGASWGTGSTLPDNDSFTASSPDGSIYYEVGRWTDSQFLPSGPIGNLLATGTVGFFAIQRA